MDNPKLILIAGRSLKQGTGMNIGKESADYQTAVSTLEMNDEDMNRLGLQDGDPVRIKSAGGEVIANCRNANVPEGLTFMAYGPLSSQLMDQETHGSGMPDSKGLEVEVERVA
jgi:formylmethanofuran dehydrogenase subunit D